MKINKRDRAKMIKDAKAYFLDQLCTAEQECYEYLNDAIDPYLEESDDFMDLIEEIGQEVMEAVYKEKNSGT